MTATRTIPLATRPWADSNIRPRLALDRASWIACPEAGDAPGMRLRCRFTLAAARELTIALSADQRFELFCDGQRIGAGPDRGDLQHWAAQGYVLSLDAGEHLFEATVWSLGNAAPLAAITREPGFILAAEDEADAALVDTGSAPWEVAPITGYTSYPAPAGVFGVGGSFEIDHAAASAAPVWRQPTTVAGPQQPSIHGIRRDQWRLDPSPLPEQIHQPMPLGRVRVVDDGSADTFGETAEDTLARWRAALDGDAPGEIAAGESVRVVVDLETYACAYTELVVDGRGEIELEWSESAYDPVEGSVNRAIDQHHSPKGDRSALIGKRWRGFGDRFLADGSAGQTFQPPWWHAGRYLLLRATAGEGGLRLRRLRLFESRYPLEDEGAFTCDSEGFDAIRALCVRGLQMCAHEHYMDCPFYEQLMYVGDTRIQALVHFCLQRDHRLQARAIDLFDWSRAESGGFIAERYPCRQQQLSLSFSLIWPLMVHDFAQWRDDAPACRRWLAGVRALLDRFALLPTDEGLLTALPGWTFLDWIKDWQTGNPPSGIDGTSAIINLHYVLALEAAADLERWHGDPTMAERWERLAADIAARIDARFWREDRGLYADDDSNQWFSQHAQALAVLCRSIPSARSDRAFASMLAAAEGELAECTIYYSFYRLEAYRRMGRGDLIHQEFSFWKDLIDQGFVTPVETPEPARSDCHAWGSHPLYHAVASLLGLRPAAPGFAAYELRPSPGPLRELNVELPHPRGAITAELRRDGAAWSLSVDSPVPGTLHLDGEAHELAAGKQVVQLTATA